MRFFSLPEIELSTLDSDILRKFFLFEVILTVLQNSSKLFLKILIMVYHPGIDEHCKQNLLDFFDVLNGEKTFKIYIYDIIKEFSESNTNLLLK